MKNFDVSTDSTCDLYAEEIREKGLFFVPLHYTLAEKDGLNEYLDDYQTKEEYKEYYDKLRAGIVSKTSMLNYACHLEHFYDMAQRGVKEAIHFTISYGLSPTVDVARQAVEEVQKTYPDFHVLCVESHTTTVGQGMLVNIAVDMRDKGKTLQETYDYVNSVKEKIQHFIVVKDLMYLKRGGRISGAAAVVGTMLDIHPVIVFNKIGKLENYMKVRGLKKTFKTIVKEFEKYTLNADYPTVYVAHTDNEELAQDLAAQLKEAYGVTTEIRMIGPIIGSHLGPDAVAYAFLSNEERPI